MDGNQQSLFDFTDHDSPGSSDPNTGFLFRSVNWLIGLMECPGIGPNKALTIASRFHNLEEIAVTNPEYLTRLLKGTELDIRSIREVDATPPDDVQVVTYFDEIYPAGLRDLPNPPPVLWYRGELSAEPATAVVGTRHPSQAGLNFAQQAGEIASELGVSIVSGLALGIDTAAHQGSLLHSGTNIAVLACDVRHPTPRSNIKIADSILENGGCLVAEVPPGTETESRNLVARNRIQAAWARNLIMAECGIPSGTLHTVRFALEINRPVGVFVSEYQASGGTTWLGNLALASEEGLDPVILGGTKSFQVKIRDRKPCADELISSKYLLKKFIEAARS